MNWLLNAAAGAFFNCVIRGGFIKNWLPWFRGGDFLNAVGFGYAVYCQSYNPSYSVMMAIAMYIGAMFKIFDPDSDLALRINDKMLWVQVVAERAFLWVLPMMVVTGISYGNAAWWWLLAIPAMPAAYSVQWWLKSRYDWPIAETIFGIALWSIIKVPYISL